MPGKYDGRKLVFGGPSFATYSVSQPEEGGDVSIDFNIALMTESEKAFEAKLASNAAFAKLQ